MFPIDVCPVSTRLLDFIHAYCAFVRPSLLHFERACVGCALADWSWYRRPPLIGTRSIKESSFCSFRLHKSVIFPMETSFSQRLGIQLVLSWSAPWQRGKRVISFSTTKRGWAPST